jgi:hypothetical protein
LVIGSPKYYQGELDTFFHEPAFVFALSYALTYLFPDTTFEGYVTVHFASCWKTYATYDGGTGIYQEIMEPCDFNNCCSVTFSRQLSGYSGETYLTVYSLNLDSSTQCYSSPPYCYNVCKAAFWPEESIHYYPLGQNNTSAKFIIDLPGLGSPYRINSEGDLMNFDNSISVQPNPVSDKLNIKIITPESGNYSYRIYDYQGNLIESIKITSANRTFSYVLDLSKYAEGIYFIKGNDAGTDSKTVSFVVIK